MEEKFLTLSSSGIKNINTSEKEFIFVFGNIQIKMKSLFADFISPIVSRLHRSDPTIQSIDICYNSNSNLGINTPLIEDIFSEDIIQLFCDLSNGNSITLTEEQSIKMRLVSILIGNDELFDQLCTIFPIEINQTNIDRYLTELQKFEYLSQVTTKNEFNFSIIIDLISTRFYSINEEKLLKLPKRILFLIIKNANLKIINEDRLFDFIKSISFNTNDEEDYSIIDFFELLCLDYLSEEKIIELIQNLNLCEVTEPLWNNISQFLCTRSAIKEQNETRHLSPFVNEFKYDGNELNAFKGIIHFLTKKYGGNVSDKGVVVVTSSSMKRPDVSARFAVELDDKFTYMFTCNMQNSWVKYDFVKRKVIPSHYSIRSYPSSSVSEHLRNWVIEGSNDDASWVLLDERDGVSCLNDRSAFHTFNVQQKVISNEGFRYIRLRQTGTNSSGQNELSLSALEYFGYVI